MLRSRIIPFLLFQDNKLVKPIKYKNSKYVGDPLNAVKIFNEKIADELSIYDITATKKNEINFSLLEKIAKEARMPLCYGGGIHKVEDAMSVIRLGFEKISIGSSVINNPGIIQEIASKVGSQSVVITFDVKFNKKEKKYQVFINNGVDKVSGDLIDLCNQCVGYGAGEIVVSSIDREATKIGYDLELAEMLYKELPIPVTIVGGCGSVEDMQKLISITGVIGVGVGEYFLFKGPFRAVLINYQKPILL